MIETIKKRIRLSNTTSLFHDSRDDVRQLAKLINEMLDKQTEIITALSILSVKLERLEKKIKQESMG